MENFKIISDKSLNGNKNNAKGDYKIYHVNWLLDKTIQAGYWKICLITILILMKKCIIKHLIVSIQSKFCKADSENIENLSAEIFSIHCESIKMK